MVVTAVPAPSIRTMSHQTSMMVPAENERLKRISDSLEPVIDQKEARDCNGGVAIKWAGVAVEVVVSDTSLEGP
jgi:hypothetical protein